MRRMRLTIGTVAAVLAGALAVPTSASAAAGAPRLPGGSGLSRTSALQPSATSLSAPNPATECIYITSFNGKDQLHRTLCLWQSAPMTLRATYDGPPYTKRVCSVTDCEHMQTMLEIYQGSGWPDGVPHGDNEKVTDGKWVASSGALDYDHNLPLHVDLTSSYFMNCGNRVDCSNFEQHGNTPTSGRRLTHGHYCVAGKMKANKLLWTHTEDRDKCITL